MPDFSIIQRLLITLLFAVTAVVHGTFGIGFPMLPTAGMSLFINMQEAVILTVWPNLFINSMVLFSGGSVQKVMGRYWPLAGAALVGSGLGAYLLFVIAQATLQLLLAGAIFVYVYFGFRGYQLRLAGDNRRLAVGFGFLAGGVGGATNAMAPILMIYLFSVTEDKTELAQAANLCFLLGKIAQIVIIYRQPTATIPDFTFLLVLVIVTIGAILGGIRLRHRVPTPLFRKLILSLLLFLGGMLLWRALPNLA